MVAVVEMAIHAGSWPLCSLERASSSLVSHPNINRCPCSSVEKRAPGYEPGGRRFDSSQGFQQRFRKEELYG